MVRQKIILRGHVRQMESEMPMDRHDGEEYFAMALFSPLKDGEMAMVYSAIAKRHKIS